MPDGKGEVAMAEFVANKQPHPGVRSPTTDVGPNAALPAWVTELTAVERQLAGWGDPTAQTHTDGLRSWVAPGDDEGSGAHPAHPSLLHADPAALGIDPRELYFWDVRGYLVLRGAMDPEWIADANAALDEAIATQTPPGELQDKTASGLPPATGLEMPGFETALWKDLSPSMQAAAAALGWCDASSWEAAVRTPACELEWGALADTQREAASTLGFGADSWPKQAFFSSYGSLGIRRLGSPLAGAYPPPPGSTLAQLLELPCKHQARHPFRRMICHAPLLARIQWMQGPGYQLISQPRAILTAAGSQAHLLHGMIPGPEG
jgi:hypothetical protein